MFLKCFHFSPYFALGTLIWWLYPHLLHLGNMRWFITYALCIDHYSIKINTRLSLLHSHGLPNLSPPIFPYILVMLPWLTTIVVILLLHIITPYQIHPSVTQSHKLCPLTTSQIYLHPFFLTATILWQTQCVSFLDYFNSLLYLHLGLNFPFHPPHPRIAAVFFLKGKSDHALLVIKCL